MAQILHVEPTPNPLAYKLVLDQNVTMGVAKNYSKKEETFDNLLAQKFFDIHGVESVFFLDNFITVTKTVGGIADFIFFQAQEIIRAAKDIVPLRETAGCQGTSSLSQAEFENLSGEEKLVYIDAVFDESIRPGLARDGGGLKLLGFENNVVKVRYEGACGSCPSSSAQTLNYISNLLQSRVSPHLTVLPV